MSSKKHRKPTIFKTDDASIHIAEQHEKLANNQALNENPLSQTSLDNQSQNKSGPGHQHNIQSKFLSWGFLLLSSLTGLIAIWASAAIITSIKQLLARQDLLGWGATTLAVIALFSLFILIIKEFIAIASLKKLGQLRATGLQIHNDNKLKPARRYVKSIKRLYDQRPDRRWILDRLKTREGEIMDGRELIELIDHEIGKPLDLEARAIIANTAKKVSLITAIAPGPILDMIAVTVLNIRMISRIAQTYGTRPGFFGQLRLTRNVITHMALSGGIAVTSDLLSPLIGTGIAAKLSKRLGEGLFNGALTIRIGLSAVELSRPVPYVSEKRLSFSKLVTSSLSLKGDKKTA